MDGAYVVDYVIARTAATVDRCLNRIEASRRDIAASRRRRWLTIRGGSTTDPATEHLRERVRLFVNRHEVPRIQAGYTMVPKRCDACGRLILRGSSEYDIAFAALSFVLDGACFGVWQDEMTKAKTGPT